MVTRIGASSHPRDSFKEAADEVPDLDTKEDQWGNGRLEEHDSPRVHYSP